MDSTSIGAEKSASESTTFQKDEKLITDFVSESRLGIKKGQISEAKTSGILHDNESDANNRTGALPHFELVAEQRTASAADSRNNKAVESKKETVINIADVDKRIGWWQKQEYQKLGVERIRLADHSVVMELAKPVRKGAIVTSLDIDKVFAFNFDRGPNKWELTNVRGLKVGGDPVSGVEITPTKNVIFWLDKNKTDRREYGKQAAEFIKALADPLMADYLRR